MKQYPFRDLDGPDPWQDTVDLDVFSNSCIKMLNSSGSGGGLVYFGVYGLKMECLGPRCMLFSVIITTTGTATLTCTIT